MDEVEIILKDKMKMSKKIKKTLEIHSIIFRFNYDYAVFNSTKKKPICVVF